MNTGNENGESPAASNKQTNSLSHSIGARIKTLSRHKFKYRKKFVRFSLIVGAIASVNAFLVGVSQIFIECKILGVLAFLASSAIAFSGVLDSVLKPKEMWARNAETVNNLYDLRERIRYKLLRNGSITLDELDAFHDEFRRLEKDFFGSTVDTLSETEGGSTT